MKKQKQICKFDNLKEFIKREIKSGVHKFDIEFSDYDARISFELKEELKEV